MFCYFSALRQHYSKVTAFVLSLLLSLSLGYFPAFASEASDSPSMDSYLDGVASLFSWILEEIGVLITFIMGNPFLAVSLYLFMAGVVIAFFVRIKMS